MAYIFQDLTILDIVRLTLKFFKSQYSIKRISGKEGKKSWKFHIWSFSFKLRVHFISKNVLIKVLSPVVNDNIQDHQDTLPVVTSQNLWIYGRGLSAFKTFQKYCWTNSNIIESIFKRMKVGRYCEIHKKDKTLKF